MYERRILAGKNDRAFFVAVDGQVHEIPDDQLVYWLRDIAARLTDKQNGAEHGQAKP